MKERNERPYGRELCRQLVSKERVTPWPQATAIATAACAIVCLLAAGAMGQIPTPRKIKDVRPVYPRESLQAGDEGGILLELDVNPSGAVSQARILRSECKRLEQAALSAVTQWEFTQLHVNGRPVPFKMVADVPFRLPEQFKERAGRVGACKWKEPPAPTRSR